MNVYSYCDAHSPHRPSIPGWWIKNHIPITCSVCHELKAGWIYVGTESDHTATTNKLEDGNGKG